MFADPQTVTINAVPITLNRTSTGTNTGALKKDDGLVGLSFSHRYGKRIQRRARLDHAKIAADPLLAGVNVKAGLSVSLVIDHPETGYTIAEVKQVVDGLTAYLTASSGANVTKILGGES
nr:MAG: hypothetical protein 2 [Leviviridae sp.]